MTSLLTAADRVRARAWRATTRTRAGRRLLGDRDLRLSLLALGHLLTALALATVAPLPALLLGPILFGVPHIVSDVRYLLLNRERPVDRTTILLVLTPLALLPIARATAGMIGVDGAPLELALGLAAILLAIARAPLAPLARAIVLAALVTAGVALLPRAVGVLVIVAQVHNAVALVAWLAFWRTGTLRKAALAAFFTVAAAAILEGAFDPLLASGGAFAGLTFQSLADTFAPGMDGRIVARLVALFAFGQASHYAIWLRLMPQTMATGPAPLSFRRGLARLARDLGLPGFAAAIALTLAVPAAALFSPVFARDAYLFAALFHGWMELAILAHLALRARASRGEFSPA
ncbi:MAG TPA: hypothetical protein VMV18_11335 [bacterium]|nr:hypothetical protein [bacterium]